MAEPTRTLGAGPRHRARLRAERGHPRTGRSHSQTHAVPAPALRRTRLVLTLLLVPALLATIVGLIVLWPERHVPLLVLVRVFVLVVLLVARWRRPTALAGLVMTAALGAWAVDAARITEAVSDEALWLPQITPGLRPRESTLCGLVLASMGVLNGDDAVSVLVAPRAVAREHPGDIARRPCRAALVTG